MTAIETLLRQPASLAVGWALLQFVWQGAAVGGLTALALLALRRNASDVRYVVASIGLALMLTLPIVTGVQRYQALRTAASAAPVGRRWHLHCEARHRRGARTARSAAAGRIQRP